MYLASFPKKLRYTARTFRAISRLWYVDKPHPEVCFCDGCASTIWAQVAG